MLETISNATEKTIRYVIPGIWIYILIILLKPINNQNLGLIDLLAPTIGSGIIVYIFFRQILETVEHWIFNGHNAEILSEKFMKLYRSPKEISDYLNFKFATTHVAELLPLISLFMGIYFGIKELDKCWVKCVFIIMNGIIFLSGVLNHYILYKITNKIYEKLKNAA